MFPIRRLTVLSLALLVLVALGCTGDTQAPPTHTDAHDDHGHDHSAHAHPTQGPHQGELIELGNEEYHAELLHDSQSVTIYLLDSTGRKSCPIADPTITINATGHGTPQQFSLAAQPADGDPAGQSSRFRSNDATLVQSLENGDRLRLALAINGKSYRGDIAHDHAGHDDHHHAEDAHGGAHDDHGHSDAAHGDADHSGH